MGDSGRTRKIDETQSLTRVSYSADLENQSVSFEGGSDYKPGDMVGESYRLLHQIGRGGMGVVYLAEHTIIKQRYALKLLAPEQITVGNWKRFELEGKALAKLDHRNIVRIYNMGIDRRGCPFYVMEWLPGAALQDEMDRARLDTADALAIYRQVCEGLKSAHGAGIVHRDIKPSNIMLTGDVRQPGTVKLVDFGIASLGTLDRVEQGLTGRGEIFGNPLYMSPEQCAGSGIDSRSDIYSLGCSLFHTLTGRPPHCGASAIETIMLHQSEDAPRLSSTGDFGQPLEKLVSRMLSRSLESRYQSIDQVAHDLQRVESGKSVGLTRLGDITSQGLEALSSEQHRQVGKRYFVAGAITIALAALTTAALLEGSLTRMLIPPQARRPATIIDTIADPPRYSDMGEHAKKQLSDAAARGIDRVATGGGYVHIWHFPKNFSLGTVSYGKKDGKRELQGDVTIPEGKDLYLSLRSEIKSYPRYLQLLNDEPIIDLKLDRVKEPAHVLSQLTDWNKLRKLRFYACGLKANHLELIEKIKTVDHLTIEVAELTGNELLTSNLLKRLQSLELVDIKDNSALIAELVNYPRLQILTLSDVELSPPDIQHLADNDNLVFLRLSWGQLDNDMVRAISRNRKIEVLQLVNGNYDPSVLAQIARMKQLKSLRIDLGENVTAAQEEKLQRALPNCELFLRALPK